MTHVWIEKGRIRMSSELHKEYKAYLRKHGKRDTKANKEKFLEKNIAVNTFRERSQYTPTE